MFWTFELYCHLVSRYFWFYKFTSKNLRRILITPKTIYEKGLLQQTVYVQGPVSFLGWQFAFQAKLSSSCELASHQFSRYVHCLPEVLLAMRKEKAKNQINFNFISMCFFFTSERHLRSEQPFPTFAQTNKPNGQAGRKMNKQLNRRMNGRLNDRMIK